jgi:beta-lactamase superfamily II metal-dependent hydrolase
MKKVIFFGLIILMIAMLNACSQGTGTNMEDISGDAVLEDADEFDDEGFDEESDILDNLEEDVEEESSDEVMAIADQKEAETLETQPEENIEELEPEPEMESAVKTSKEILEEEYKKSAIFSPKLFVHFIDVGYGDAILIQTPKNKNIMIDCGHDKTQRQLRQYLNAKGVEQIDALIVTNTEDEYIGGCDDLLYAYDVQKVYDNSIEVNSDAFHNLVYAIEDKGVTVVHVRQDLLLNIDQSTEMKIISPLSSLKYLPNIRDNSLLVKLNYGDTNFLFTGSCQKGCERELLEKGTNLDADVLKVGGHGTEDASISLFLDAVSPSVAVISIDADITDKEPSLSAIDRLRKVGATIYRTDYDSTVRIASDGNEFKATATLGVPRWDPEVNVSYTPYHLCPYIGHRISNMFYSVDCNYINDIAPQNRICFGSRDDAIESGRREPDRC